MHACMLSCFSRVRLFAIPWTVAHRTTLSMGFSTQEYWSDCHFLLHRNWNPQTLWWDFKMVQMLWKTVWKFLKKLKIELSYDPAIPLAGLYPIQMKAGLCRGICTPMFIVALFTIAKEGLMLKLKLQYFGHLMPRANLLEKTLMLGKTEGRGQRGWQRMRWLDGITNSFWPHGLQHTRLPCLSPSPRACSNSCPLSQWYYPTILSSVFPFSFNLSQHQGRF